MVEQSTPQEFTDSPETREILTRARALIESPTRWCQHMMARDTAGTRCDADDPTAACWCANGAVDHIDGEFATEHKIIVPAGATTTPFGTAAHGLLARATLDMFGERTRTKGRDIYASEIRITHLWEVNDFLGHEAVMQLFDAALTSGGADSPPN